MENAASWKIIYPTASYAVRLNSPLPKQEARQLMGDEDLYLPMWLAVVFIKLQNDRESA